MLKSEFIVLIYCATVCYGIRQQITFYTGANCTGDGLILESKQSNLAPEAPRILSSHRSTLGVGAWQVHDGFNFTDGEFYFASEDESPYCSNYSMKTAKSARYMGPSDTTTNSLSLYDEGYFYGAEITITGPAFVNIPFVPQSIWTTGATSWTFYSGDNFDGTATCFIPRSGHWNDWIRSLNSTMSNVRSIARGCERRIDHFIYGGSEIRKVLSSPNV